jgi:hypothetical protein
VMTGVDALKTKLYHPALTVKENLGSMAHVRRFFQVVGYSLPNNYIVHNSSLSNLVRGVLTRVLLYKGKPTPKPRPGIYIERLSYFRKRLMKYFSSTTPISRQEFVEYYKGRRKIVYQSAVDSLYCRSIQQRDSHVKAFVKAEFINSDEKVDPDPRVISPRDPRYNVEVGRYLRPVEHRIYHAIDDIFGDVTVFKGYNAEQMGHMFEAKWDSFRKPVAIGLDASRFDQHISREALEWEHSVYDGVFKRRELRKLLSWQLKNTVRGYCKEGKLKYDVEGVRMSGDINTALGNCLIMCSLVHAYLAQKGIHGKLANNGDDCVVIIESKHLNLFQDGLEEWFLEMGFNMKVEKPQFDIEGIEFCQTHPIYTPSGYIMVRNFPKSISKDCLSLKRLDQPHVCKMWLDAVGQGGLSLTGGIPVYQDFYSSYIRSASLIKVQRSKTSRNHNKGEHVVEGGLSWLSKNMKRHYVSPCARTRHSFYIAFGVTPEQQVALEDYYRSVSWSYNLRNFGRLVHLPKWA